MTDDTSSPSAKDITLEDGPPPIDPSSDSTWSESKERRAEFMIELLQSRYPSYTIIDGTKSRGWWKFRLKSEWGRLTHFLGVHWYIEGETYDPETDSVSYAGFHCFYCDRTP